MGLLMGLFAFLHSAQRAYRFMLAARIRERQGRGPRFLTLARDIASLVLCQIGFPRAHPQNLSPSPRWDPWVATTSSHQLLVARKRDPQKTRGNLDDLENKICLWVGLPDPPELRSLQVISKFPLPHGARRLNPQYLPVAAPWHPTVTSMVNQNLLDG
jgi:hypothetical protein